MNTVSLVGLLIAVLQIISRADANWVTGEEIIEGNDPLFWMRLFEGNLCWSMPCLNGGSCFGSAYTYLCVCPIDYSGVLCEKRLGRFP